MSTLAVKIALENNFKVNQSPLLKKAIDCIVELETQTKEPQEKNCRLEERISKWKEDYICLENLKDNQIVELLAHNEKLTQHLEPQAMTALFEQVEEEIELEQKVKKLEAYNEKLLNGDIEKYNKIVSLETEKDQLKTRNAELAGQKASLERWFGEAKSIIKLLLDRTYCEGWNYSLDVKVKAEKFLKECENG